MKLAPMANLSAFLAKRDGVLSLDLVFKHDTGKETPVAGRVSIPRSNLRDVHLIAAMPVKVLELNPAVACIMLGDTEVRLNRQQSGHYYGRVNPTKPEAATDEEFFGSEQMTETSEEVPF